MTNNNQQQQPKTERTEERDVDWGREERKKRNNKMKNEKNNNTITITTTKIVSRGNLFVWYLWHNSTYNYCIGTAYIIESGWMIIRFLFIWCFGVVRCHSCLIPSNSTVCVCVCVLFFCCFISPCRVNASKRTLKRVNRFSNWKQKKYTRFPHTAD